jgi:hypothetical protein
MDEFLPDELNVNEVNDGMSLAIVDDCAMVLAPASDALPHHEADMIESSRVHGPCKLAPPGPCRSVATPAVHRPYVLDYGTPLA